MQVLYILFIISLNSQLYIVPNNGGSTVLLYGGEGLYTPSNDYCYTLDLKTFIWTQHNIQAPSIDPRRSKHSGRPKISIYTTLIHSKYFMFSCIGE
jgi:hypothetical protein